MVPHQLPVGSGAYGNMLYLFNGNIIKIAKLADPRDEKKDGETFFRILFNVTIGERDITNQVIGTRYFLNNLKVENFKYKLSANEVESISKDITDCSDLKFNVTYTMNDTLCQNAKDYINSKIDDLTEKYSKYITFDGDDVYFGSSTPSIYIQKQSIYIYL